MYYAHFGDCSFCVPPSFLLFLLPYKMPETSTNKFGDTLHEILPGEDVTPFDVSLYAADASVVLKGFEEACEGTTKLCESVDHGVLYGTPAMAAKWPRIEMCQVHCDAEPREYLCGSTCVVLVSKIPGGPPTHAVLVQTRGRGRPENPVGYVLVGETHEEAVLRRVKEETGLAIVDDSLKLLGVHTFNSGFAGLKWPGMTRSYYGYAVAPPNIPLVVRDVVVTESPCDDILCVMYVSIRCVKHMCDDDGLHNMLIQRALSCETKMPYLKSFEWVSDE